MEARLERLLAALVRRRRQYLNTLHQWFVKPEPDGRFHISGVEPGTYDFAVNLYGTTEGCLVHPIATGVVHFTVKPGDKQLDLGKVSIPSFTLPKVGDVAADFEFAAPDGTKSHLAALRGKYVLIDFWATWCGPCVAKLDEIERLRKEFRADKELVVVGANLDSDPERTREFLKSKPLPWQHALLGDWANTDVPRRYAISSVPACVLIDPQGRILASEYSLESLEGKLKDLSKKPITSPTKNRKAAGAEIHADNANRGGRSQSGQSRLSGVQSSRALDAAPPTVRCGSKSSMMPTSRWRTPL